MTILQALQSLAEYDNDNLLAKVLADNSLTPADTYVSATHKNKVYSAVADLYDAMAVLPEFKDGSSTNKWDSKALRAEANSIRRRIGIGKATISGASIW